MVREEFNFKGQLNPAYLEKGQSKQSEKKKALLLQRPGPGPSRLEDRAEG